MTDFDFHPGPFLSAPDPNGGVVNSMVLYFQGDEDKALRLGHMLADGMSPMREIPDRCYVRRIDGASVALDGRPPEWWERLEITVRYRTPRPICCAA